VHPTNVEAAVVGLIPSGILRYQAERTLAEVCLVLRFQFFSPAAGGCGTIRACMGLKRNAARVTVFDLISPAWWSGDRRRIPRQCSRRKPHYFRDQTTSFLLPDRQRTGGSRSSGKRSRRPPNTLASGAAEPGVRPPFCPPACSLTNTTEIGVLIQHRQIELLDPLRISPTHRFQRPYLP
jgi:hypothetical protein